MSPGLYFFADDPDDLGPIWEGVDVSPHGTRERPHHFEVGGRDGGCLHDDRQRGTSIRSAAPLKRGLARTARWIGPAQPSSDVVVHSRLRASDLVGAAMQLPYRVEQRLEHIVVDRHETRTPLASRRPLMRPLATTPSEVTNRSRGCSNSVVVVPGEAKVNQSISTRASPIVSVSPETSPPGCFATRRRLIRRCVPHH